MFLYILTVDSEVLETKLFKTKQQAKEYKDSKFKEIKNQEHKYEDINATCEKDTFNHYIPWYYEQPDRNECTKRTVSQIIEIEDPPSE